MLRRSAYGLLRPRFIYLSIDDFGDNAQADGLAVLAGRKSTADVILVDQRGFSQRGDILRFKAKRFSLPLDKPATIEQSTAAAIQQAQATVAEYAKGKVDLRGYTVLECADDVDDLRRALG